MTRDEKRAEARRLRTQGLTAREIAERIGANESTVRNWYLGRDCDDCGAPLDGGSGDASPNRCFACSQQAIKDASRQWILDSLQEWEDIYGSPPSALDWNPAMARHKAHASRMAKIKAAHEARQWPGVALVQRHFGSWSNALREAGLGSLAPGHRRDPEGWYRNRWGRAAA